MSTAEADLLRSLYAEERAARMRQRAQVMLTEITDDTAPEGPISERYIGRGLSPPKSRGTAAPEAAKLINCIVIILIKEPHKPHSKSTQ